MELARCFKIRIPWLTDDVTVVSVIQCSLIPDWIVMVVKQCLNGSVLVRRNNPGSLSYQTNNATKTTAHTWKTEYTPRYIPRSRFGVKAFASDHHFNQTALEIQLRLRETRAILTYLEMSRRNREPRKRTPEKR